MSPLFVLGLLKFGLIANRLLHRWEGQAAADVASRLQGKDKKVEVHVRPRGLAAAWGELESAEIRADDFSLEGLPLFVEPDKSKAGILDRLVLDLHDFRLRGLEVRSLHADIPHCRYDFGLAKREKKIRLTRSGVGTGSVEIEQDALARYIVYKFHEIKQCSVKVESGVVWVEGYGEFLIAKTKFEVVAHVAPVNSTQLVLTDAKIFFDWTRADQAASHELLKLLNPVVDLRRDLRLYDAVDVKGVSCEGGVLKAWGATKIPDRPAKTGT